MPASVTNYPGPDELRIVYTVAGLTHVQRLNCQVNGYPAGAFTMADLDFLTKVGGTVQADTAIDAWVVLFKALLNAANSTLDYAELWHYEFESFVAAFQCNYPISVAGTSGSSNIAAGQAIFTFRTQEGGKMRLDFMETVIAVGTSLQYSALNAGQQAIVDFVLSNDNWILARDTSYPNTFHQMHPGQNEALFKARYRP